MFDYKPFSSLNRDSFGEILEFMVNDMIHSGRHVKLFRVLLTLRQVCAFPLFESVPVLYRELTASRVLFVDPNPKNPHILIWNKDQGVAAVGPHVPAIVILYVSKALEEPKFKVLLNLSETANDQNFVGFFYL
jgi:hypothetical protein